MPLLTTLGEIVRSTGGTIQTGPFGSQLHASDYQLEGTPLVMPTNLRDNGIAADGIARIGDEDVKRLARHKFRPGDIVFSRRGDVGRRALVREDQRGWICGTGCLAVRFGKNLTDISPAYIAHLVGARTAQSWLVDNAVGATMLNLNTGILGALPLAVPSKDEQDSVVGALDDAHAQVDLLEATIAKKKLIRIGAMQHLLSNGHPDDGEWSLGDLATFLSGGTPRLDNAAFWAGNIPWISALTLKELEVRDSDRRVTAAAVVAGSKMAPIGSTLLLVRGSALHSEIRASLVVGEVCFNQDVKALVPKHDVLPKFLTYSLHANADRLLRMVTSAGNTAGVLDTKALKNMKVWVPDTPRQDEIVTILDDMSDELHALERRLESARAVKQGMMQELLTGHTRLVEGGAL
ncbi:restriction endonuclease subunit S [Microbacterium sp. NPDC056044]|uniref:restriction endonuclease subunit S n=1 Tax=Microbacterium sp. NPDC056044 TaxID=3345690 RepID=UPI0035E0FB40